MNGVNSEGTEFHAQLYISVYFQPPLTTGRMGDKQKDLDKGTFLSSQVVMEELAPQLKTKVVESMG